MDLVKLEIDGKRIIAENRQTILEVARQNGIANIPTLCHDGQLEPFSSCFLCVVKVRGARTLIPACSTRVSAGMVVETDTPEIRRSRKAALEMMLSNHYADCLGPCQLACPAGVDIQGYISLAARGKYHDAIRVIKERNPLPAVCGRVCTRPCEVRGCRRSLVDEPVGIDFIKRYVADLDLGEQEPFHPAVPPPNGKRVAVVGAGPAGLSCAYYLACKGYGVHIFESQPEAGGMLRYGIPEYRLPKEILDLEVNQILDLGVKLFTNMTLGKDFSITSLGKKGFDAIFLGLGAWDSSKMRVQNENASGVLAGIDFLRDFGLRHKIDLAGRVLVVGGGNTAIDCARSALRLGVDEVRLLYRRTRSEMPANEMEIVEAEHEGIAMDFLVAPVRVVEADGRVSGLECVRMELGEPDASGRRSPKPIRGSEFVIACDHVIAAIGQGTKVQELLRSRLPSFLPFGEVLNLTRWQTIQVNEGTYETSVEGVFSGGDVATGAATAVEAIAAGRKAAYSIDTYVRTGRARPEPREFCSRKDAFRKVTVQDLRDNTPIARRAMPSLPVDERVRGFVEVEQGYTLEDLKKETRRCLECGCVALFDCKLREYATEYGVDISSFLGEAREHRIDRSHPLIELDPNKCILCGRCVRMCSEVVGVAAYGFVNRGFNTVVRPALGESLLSTECVTCGLCIGTCPTGAIVPRVPLERPGPWHATSVATTCHYCGVGCGINYDVFGDSLVKVSRHEGAVVTHSNHCRKGRFGQHYVQAPDRLRTGHLRAGRELQESTLEETISYAGMRLKDLVKRYAPDEIAVFVSPRLTNEEIYLAQKFARVALRTHNVTSFAHLVNQDLACPEVISTATYDDLHDAQAIVVVNSRTDEENFVADLFCKRAIRNGGRMIYVGPEVNRTSHFAEVFLKCHEGRQAETLVGLVGAYHALRPDSPLPAELARLVENLPVEEAARASGVTTPDLERAARILGDSILKVMLFSKDYRGERARGDERIIAAAARTFECSLLALREKANMQGLLDMGASPTWLPGYISHEDAQAVDSLEKEWCVALADIERQGPDVAALLRQKKIKLAVVLGEDPVGCEGFPRELVEGLLSAQFLVVGDVTMTPTAAAANVVLPLCSAAETSGTMTSSERRVQHVARAIPPLAGMETWQIISRLAAQMGHRFKMKYASAAEVTAEIQRAVPIYRDVVPGSAESDGIWAVDGCKPCPPHPLALGDRIRPVATLFLDPLESRFAGWFAQIMGEARAREETRMLDAMEAPC